MTLDEAYRILQPTTVQVNQGPEVNVLEVEPETHWLEFMSLARLTADEDLDEESREALRVFVLHRMEGWAERELQHVDR